MRRVGYRPDWQPVRGSVLQVVDSPCSPRTIPGLARQLAVVVAVGRAAIGAQPAPRCTRIVAIAVPREVLTRNRSDKWFAGPRWRTPHVSLKSESVEPWSTDASTAGTTRRWCHAP